MSSFERKTTYFNGPGEQNTDTLLALTKEYVEKECIEDIIVASTTGKTGARAAKTFKDRNVVVVTHTTLASKKLERQSCLKNTVKRFWLVVEKYSLESTH